jgi:predicted RNA-binding Zn-ribbon protein involved in translation (DUF1610 family)
MDLDGPDRGPAAATQALLRAGFVEVVFHCPSCGLGGTGLARPAALHGDRPCLDCGEPTVVTVLSRFARG